MEVFPLIFFFFFLVLSKLNKMGRLICRHGQSAKFLVKLFVIALQLGLFGKYVKYVRVKYEALAEIQSEMKPAYY